MEACVAGGGAQALWQSDMRPAAERAGERVVMCWLPPARTEPLNRLRCYSPRPDKCPPPGTTACVAAPAMSGSSTAVTRLRKSSTALKLVSPAALPSTRDSMTGMVNTCGAGR